MTRLEYDDLPAKLKAAVDAAVVRPERKPRTSQRAAPVKGGRWRCATCGNEAASLTATERHADQARHHRYDFLLDG